MSLMLLAASSSGNLTTAIGQAEWVAAGTYTWTCPAGVYEVSALCVGAGSRGGGGTGWKNAIPVTPGQTYTVRVGVAFGTSGTGDSYFISLTTVAGKCANTGGTFVGDGGGNGGAQGTGSSGTGGGGAGGYAGNGGKGGNCGTTSTPGSTGSGGGGGGGGGGYHTYTLTSAEQERWYEGGGGGGIGLYGQGSSGVAGAVGTSSSPRGAGGKGGSGGADGTNGPRPSTQDTWVGGSGGQFGGGAGAGYLYTIDGSPAYSNQAGTAQGGAVRLMWGVGRAYPSTRTANE